jgi:hypothetical protein
MTREELKSMERFAAISNSRLEEVTDKYEYVKQALQTFEQ